MAFRILLFQVQIRCARHDNKRSFLSVDFRCEGAVMTESCKSEPLQSISRLLTVDHPFRILGFGGRRRGSSTCRGSVSLAHAGRAEMKLAREAGAEGASVGHTRRRRTTRTGLEFLTRTQF